MERGGRSETRRSFKLKQVGFPMFHFAISVAWGVAKQVELPRRQDYHFQVVGVGQVYLKGKAQGIAVYRVDRIDSNR